MAIRDKMENSARPHLQPGEQVQNVFGAQTKNGWLIGPFMLLGVLPGALLYYLAFCRFRVVVVTDRRILVCDAGRLRSTAVTSVLGELPRATRLGEPGGIWWKCLNLGEPLFVHKRFHSDIRAADRALAPI